MRSKLARLGRAEETAVSGIEPSPRISRYRNKATFAVSEDGKVGFYKRGTKEVFDCEDCLIQSEEAMIVAATVRRFLSERAGRCPERNGAGPDVKSPGSKDFTAGIKRLTVKYSWKLGELMVVFYTANGKVKDIGKLVAEIDDALFDFSEETDSDVILTGVCIVTEGRKPKCDVVAGRKTICDQLSFEHTGMPEKIRFEISPLAFYQVNREQMINIYEKAFEYAGLTGRELLLDVYCGIGTIGLSMAEHAGTVVGIEEMKPAVLDANRNAVINGIVNAIFYEGKAEDVIEGLFEEGSDFRARYLNDDVPVIALLDPPRAGCDEAVLRALDGEDVEKIVYVSCDPATLARDVRILKDLGYELEEATPFDMFAWTMHVECVCLMSRKG